MASVKARAHYDRSPGWRGQGRRRRSKISARASGSSRRPSGRRTPSSFLPTVRRCSATRRSCRRRSRGSAWRSSGGQTGSTHRLIHARRTPTTFRRHPVFRRRGGRRRLRRSARRIESGSVADELLAGRGRRTGRRVAAPTWPSRRPSRRGGDPSFALRSIRGRRARCGQPTDAKGSHSSSPSRGVLLPGDRISAITYPLLAAGARASGGGLRAADRGARSLRAALGGPWAPDRARRRMRRVRSRKQIRGLPSKHSKRPRRAGPCWRMN